MSDVWEHSPASGSELLLLLAIADFCHDDGTGAWPSIQRLAKRTRQTERNTQLLIRKLSKMGELNVEPGGGRHNTNTYSIPVKGEKISPLNPEKISPFAGNGEIQGTERVKSSVVKGEIAVSPDPSGSVIDPSLSVQEGKDARKGNRFEQPTLEAMKLHAAKIGLPDAEAEKCWHYYESNGWRVGRNPMRSWASAMINWRKNWQEHGGVNGVSRQPASVTPWAIQQVIAAKEKQAVDIKFHHASEVATGLQWSSEEARSSYRAIRTEIKTLNGQLAGMA